MAHSPQKEWAREQYRGVEDSLKTAFSPDFSTLDEDGIRHDVRHSIESGFFSGMCSSTHTTLEEKKRFIDIVVDEAGGRMLVGANVNQASLQDRRALLAHAEAAGCSHAFMGLPRDFLADSEDEVYRYFRELADSTRLPLILYGYNAPPLRRFHPSGMPLRLLDRLADIPNVIGMKLTQPIDIGLAFEVAERVGDRLLLGPANLELVPLLAKHYPVQWVGQWVVSAVQSPETPYLVEFMKLIWEHDFERAMKLYWRISPAYKHVHELQKSFLLAGTHPWGHIAFYHWCAGGNGGLPRHSKDKEADAAAALDAEGRAKILQCYERSGIVTHNDTLDSFVVGRASYARGVRPADLTATPFFTA
jgi:4-hydroxy-tetrahydrodipicolinate synthase